MTTTSSSMSLSSASESSTSLEVHSPSSILLLTGATGFLGKLVLCELIRRRDAFQLDKIILLIRSNPRESSQSRFQRRIVSSPCMADLPERWTEMIQVVKGDLTEEECGIGMDVYEKICSEITHIINCAGSSTFQLPIEEAIEANIAPALNIYRLARDCNKLVRLTHISTAYVTPHTSEPIHQKVVPLPLPAVEILENLQNGTMTTKEALKKTRHSTTFALTKCISEQMLLDLKGNIPVSIIRPSLLSATRQNPFPGWIEKTTPFAKFVSAIGTGVLHVANGDKNVLLDVMPGDDVARIIIDETLLDSSGSDDSRIVQAVATLDDSLHLGTTSSLITSHFRQQTGFNSLGLHYIGTRTLEFHTKIFVYHQLPLFRAGIWFWVTRDREMRRNVRKAKKVVGWVNDEGGMGWLMARSWDFRGGRGVDEKGRLDKGRYVGVVCQGVGRWCLGFKGHELVAKSGGRECR